METLGELAASTSKPVVVPQHMRPAAVWLESKELAVDSETGRLMLLEDALQTKTIVRSPSLVSDPADTDSQSLWTLRQQLVCSGRTACKPGASLTPSVQQKTFCAGSQCPYFFPESACEWFFREKAPLLIHQHGNTSAYLQIYIITHLHVYIITHLSADLHHHTCRSTSSDIC